MSLSYRLMDYRDLDDLRDFCSKKNYNEAQLSWTLDGLLSGRGRCLIAGEYVDDALNGIMSSCSLGYLFQVGEFAPIWIGFRVDRLRTVTPFTGFIHWIASLSTEHFESKSYFQHYIVRKLPKQERAIAELTGRSFVSGSYTAHLEAVIRSEDELEASPTMFQRMIGQFSHPVAIIHMVMRNELRKRRDPNAVRTSILL